MTYTTSFPVLSVLIPTISSRASTLSRSLWHLEQQNTYGFEVLVHQGDEIGLGDKINRMVQEARGDFIVMVDDDDYLPLHYMHTVWPTLRLSTDFVGYRILALKNGAFWLSIEHSATNQFGSQTLRRGVCNKMPIRTELARQVPFGNDYTDDWPWSEQIHNLVERSTFIDEHLYVYDWWPESMAFKNPERHPDKWAPAHDVGVWPYDGASWPIAGDRLRWL